DYIAEKIVTNKKESKTLDYTPFTARKALDVIGISELELYRRAEIPLSQSEKSAIGEVADFIADFDYSKFLQHGDSVKRGAIGRKNFTRKR
ncbi:MAG: hypothetical protein WCL30_05050, partial [Pseudomonadota bacterium]